MRKKFIANIAVSAVAFTAVCLPLAAPTSAATCDDVKFIFARGSGQSLGADDYKTYKSELESALKNSGSKISYSFYELGESSHAGAKYPAIDIGVMQVLGAKVSAGSAFAFGESVKQGITELSSYTKEVSALCPDTKFVIGGYSQGAMVITNSKDKLDANKVIYAATFGDPKLYLPEGKGLVPDACRGKNLSPYRVYAPNCHTKEGSLDAKKPYQPADWEGKLGLWCKDKDLICGAGIAFASSSGKNIAEKLVNSALSSHTSYTTDGIYKKAAKTIAEKIQQAYPSKITKINADSNRDTVFLIDRTASTSSLVAKFKQKALKITDQTLSSGGRIALYTYGELREEQKPERLADFGSDYQTIKDKLSSIKYSGGGDEPESVLSALLHVMNNQNWRAGATKSIVLVADASFHSPDIDGVTLSDVIKRSLEIDPVNIYVVNYNKSATKYQELVTKTNGKLFDKNDDTSVDLLLSRPSAEFPLESYTGALGEEFTFTLEASEGITKYEWDLDGDGSFETTTQKNSVSKTYSTPLDGFVQARVTDAAGMTSTASAKLTVTNSTANLQSISNLSAESSNGKFKIKYDKSPDTIAAIVSLNDSTLGLTSDTSFELTDLPEKSKLTITPLDNNGHMGDPASIELIPEPLAPKTGQK